MSYSAQDFEWILSFDESVTGPASGAGQGPELPGTKRERPIDDRPDPQIESWMLGQIAKSANNIKKQQSELDFVLRSAAAVAQSLHSSEIEAAGAGARGSAGAGQVEMQSADKLMEDVTQYWSHLAATSAVPKPSTSSTQRAGEDRLPLPVSLSAGEAAPTELGLAQSITLRCAELLEASCIEEEAAGGDDHDGADAAARKAAPASGPS